MFDKLSENLAIPGIIFFILGVLFQTFVSESFAAILNVLLVSAVLLIAISFVGMITDRL